MLEETKRLIEFPWNKMVRTVSARDRMTYCTNDDDRSDLHKQAVGGSVAPG